VSARHRKAQRTRCYLYRIAQHANDLRYSLRDRATVDGPDEPRLACVTDDEVDKLARLADRADAVAREVDALQATIFARLLTYEAGGTS